MHIHFNTSSELTPGTSDGHTEAKGLVALLVAMYGNDILPNNVVTTGVQPVTATPVVKAEYKVTPIAEEPEADAATAFGGTQPTPSTPVPALTPDAATAFGSVPAPGPQAPVPAVVSGELDKRGVPWDERIHSSTKAVTAKGEWQRRRNTPDDLFDSVMGELKARVSGQTQSPSAPPPPPPPASAITTTVPVPSQTGVAAAAFSTGPAAGGEEVTFTTIMVDVMKHQREGKLTKDETNNLLVSVGGAGTTMAALQDEGKRLAFHALLVDHIAMKG